MEDNNRKIIKEYGIWYPHEVFYIESMLSITRSIISDYYVIKQILKEYSARNYENEILMIDLVQNIVRNTALMSKYFWPKKQFEERGKRLRNAFNIIEPNPIKDKDVRNFLEHFDEKLDNYLHENVSVNIIPRYVGKRIIDNQNLHYFRAFFIDEWIFTILNSEIEIRPIINEMFRVHSLLEKCIIVGRFPN